MREQIQEKLEDRGGLFFFTKPFYKQCAYILALEYTDQVGYMKMKKGARVFPVNNILL